MSTAEWTIVGVLAWIALMLFDLRLAVHRQRKKTLLPAVGRALGKMLARGEQVDE